MKNKVNSYPLLRSYSPKTPLQTFGVFFLFLANLCLEGCFKLCQQTVEENVSSGEREQTNMEGIRIYDAQQVHERIRDDSQEKHFRFC